MYVELRHRTIACLKHLFITISITLSGYFKLHTIYGTKYRSLIFNRRLTQRKQISTTMFHATFTMRQKIVNATTVNANFLHSQVLRGITMRVQSMINETTYARSRSTRGYRHSQFSVNFQLNRNLCTVESCGEGLIAKRTRED